MKKITSLLMAVCMLTLCLGTAATVSAETATNKLLFEDDFSGDLSNWVRKADSNPAIDKNIPEILGGSNTTDVLWVWGDAAFGYNLETPISEGKVVFSFDVDPNKMANYDDASERAFMAFVGGEEITSSNVSSITTLNRLGALSIFKAANSTSSEFRRGWANDFAATDTKAISAAAYRHVDIVVDMDTRYAYTYLDNDKWNTGNPLPEAFTSVKSLMFNNYLNMAGVFLDNVKIVQNPTMEIESVEADEASKYVDITFSKVITSELPSVADVTIKNIATGALATVTAVTKPADNVLRVAYSDAIAGGSYTVSIDGAVETVGASVTVNNQFDVALAVLKEDFSSNTQPAWLKTANAANTTIDTTGGNFIVTQNSADDWQTVIQMNTTADETFANIYKAIRKGGTDGGTFTAGTTQLGKLSYEFDLQINTYGGTVVLYGNDRHFRINTWSSQGFHAGNSNNLGLYEQNENHKIKVVYDFEAQKISFYIDDAFKAEYAFTALMGESQNITVQDVFNLKLGVSNGCTAVFDNFVIKYTAAEAKFQDLKLTDSGNRTYTLTGSVVNPFTTSKAVTMIFAAYNGDALAYADVYDATTAAYYQTIMNKAFTVSADVTYDSVKVFVWDNFVNMTPLTGILTPQ